MQVLRMSHSKQFQRWFISGSCNSLVNSTRFGSAFLSSTFRAAAAKGNSRNYCHLCCPRLSPIRVSRFSRGNQLPISLLRFQSKALSGTNGRNLRSMLKFSDTGRRGKQVAEVGRLVELAKPEWKKLGG